MTFTANDIVTVLTALGILATVIGGIIVQIIVARKTQAEVIDIKSETTNQTKQLENIEVLVDGRYSDVLQELASVKRLLAKSSGLQIHIDNAEKAQVKADEQESRVDRVKDKK